MGEEGRVTEGREGPKKQCSRNPEKDESYSGIKREIADNRVKKRPGKSE